MNKSLRTFSIIQKISLAKTINGIAYFFRKIPLVGSFLGDKYRFYELKQIVFFFYPIFALIWQIIKSALCLAIAIGMMVYANEFISKIFHAEEILAGKIGRLSLNEYTASLLVPCFIYLAFAIFRNMIVDNGNSIYELFTNFAFDAKEIAKAHLYYIPILRFVGRSLVFVFAFKFLADVPVIDSLAMSLAILMTELAASIFWLSYLKDKEKSILDNGFIQLAIGLILSLILYVCVSYFKIPSRLTSFGFLALSIIAFIPAYNYMKSFNSYGKIIEKAARKYQIALDTVADNAANSLKIKEKDLGKGKVTGESFAYLNQVFFLRHRRIIRKPILIKSMIILLISLVLSAYMYVKGFDLKGNIDEISSFLIPLAMYILLKQDNILRSMYLNCDKGLMPYGFYREGKNVLAMYKERFKSLLKIMTIPSLALGLSYLMLASFDGTLSLRQKALSLVYIALLALFFVSLPLMEYYLLSPFNQEGQKTGKAVILIDYLIYAAVFFILPQVTSKISYGVFLIAVSIFIISFVITSQILVYKLAPKTFKIRN
ncbi:MAG: hypothetical protein E7C95_02850 [Anaerococcus prevotii]|uniref:hypothetical protein n=1 Tax=Anaerococcus prevotii TaxID=33034 RepID=UPI0028FFC57C|nr:hypothetical protein [Anaerococcus prevotii]MDU2557894.1 hypothetical protein [Anaerococcus prevotii]